MQPTTSSSTSASSPRENPARRDESPGHPHAVRFYETEQSLASEVAAHLAAGLSIGEPVIIIATGPHRAAFTERLEAMGCDLRSATQGGRLRMLDARETLASFMVDQTPDEEKFRAAVGAVISEVASRAAGTPVRAYGEMVDLLWKDGNTSGAIRLEELWNELADTHRFSLLCAYAMGNFKLASDTERFLEICDRHSHVIPTEGYAGAVEGDRGTEISLLQQRALALEAELARREETERRLTVALAEQRRASEALIRSEHHLRDFLENAAEGIHWVDGNGIILWANAAELEMLGYSADEFVGRHIADFHVDRDVIERILARLLRGETLREQGARMRHRDGSVRHVLINSNVYREDDEIIHSRCFTRDITPLVEAGAERDRLLLLERLSRAEAEEARLAAERARVAAEEANRVKSEFLAVMSHELRTPLNAISGYADLLELGVHGPLSEPQREAVGRIQRSQRHLLGLINEVLNYARIESGSVRYNLGPVVLDDVLRTADALVTPQMSAKELRYDYAGCDRSVVAQADAERLQQIVLNLLTNAVKFTDRGGHVSVECDMRGDMVVVRVSDTGLGIAADKLDSIFEPFVQIDTRLTRPQQGVGLGLAISRDLARGMGGDLRVESTPGVGTTFTLTLPRALRIVSDAGSATAPEPRLTA